MSAVLNRPYGVVRKSMGKSLAELAKERSLERARAKFLEDATPDTVTYTEKSKVGNWNITKTIDVPLDFEDTIVHKPKSKKDIDTIFWAKAVTFVATILFVIWVMYP